MGSMTPHQILWDLSQADGERLENTWWITTANETGKNQLRHTRKAKPVNVSEFMAKRP
jgi:hypothetical protein